MDSEDQDAEQPVENIYRQEFELLKGMFEEHFSSEVIAGVLEDCDGDVNHALDTLTKIESSAAGTVTVAQDIPTSSECSTSTVTECNNIVMEGNVNTSLNAPSYAAMSQNPVSTTAMKPRHATRSKNHMPKIDYWTEDIKNVIRYHNEGSRVMVVMRGAPGSGKTYLARVLIESTIGTTNPNNYSHHIFSADDYMEKNGRYEYNVNHLEEAHMRNQSRVYHAVNAGRSPIIIDNTNMATWEMYSYVRDGVKNGYIIQVIEPSNPWSKIPSQLAKRNTHGVPKEKIQMMLQKYQGTHTGKTLLECFKLSYPKGMEPPVKRNLPVFHQENLALKLIEKVDSVFEPNVNEIKKEENSDSVLKPAIQTSDTNQNSDLAIANQDLKTNKSENPNINVNVKQLSNPNDQLKQQKIEAEKSLNEFLKVEVEWDNGESWETPSLNRKPKTESASSSVPKPQRSEVNERVNKYIEPAMINDDWTKNLTFMQSSHADTASAIKEAGKIQTESSNTLVGIGDCIKDGFDNKITTLKNVNAAENDRKNEHDDKLLNQPALSNILNNSTVKSTSGFHTCEQEDKYFVNMRKMFKNIPRPVLREIYDNCAGDGNWACAIVLDGIKNNTIQTINTDVSDSEEEVYVECQCEERNNIMPSLSTETTLSTPHEKQIPTSINLFKKKARKEKKLSGESSQVLQSIKKSVKISENHYSQHQLTLRKSRYPYLDQSDENTGNKNENSTDTNDVLLQNIDFSKMSIPAQGSSTPSPDSVSEPNTLPNTTQNFLYRDIPSTSTANTYYAVPTSDINKLESTDTAEEFDCDEYVDVDDEADLNDSTVNDEKRNFAVNIGMEFVRKLDEIYGRHDFEYPEGVKPVLNIPSQILHEINALWVESITHQLDKVQTQTNEMIKQDEEFARQLELEMLNEAKEAENSAEEDNARALPEPSKPKEPDVPNFKEIMDTELALALYEKEVREEWKNREPQDLAAQMTRKKLFELFPDVANETLSEMLIAHDYSFDATVEVLLISTGQGHYLDQNNGINKFVMEKEKENKEKVMLAEQNAALDEEEYPYLNKPGQENTEPNMDTVNLMREKALKHKNARDIFFQKAKWYYERRKLAEASYYSRIASLHTARYDFASNYAAAALVQCHANSHPEANVIDLHFLRVSEAETSLDLFIDDRLRKMRLAREPRQLVLHIITGRGKHSPGKPRVKPAIMKRLRARGMSYRQQNPGLLEARLRSSHLLTNELLNA